MIRQSVNGLAKSALSIELERDLGTNEDVCPANRLPLVLIALYRTPTFHDLFHWPQKGLK
jgi:hypothetical protein